MKNIKTYEGFLTKIGNKLKNIISGEEEKLYRNELEPLLNKIKSKNNDLVEDFEDYKEDAWELFDAVSTKFNHNDDEQPLNPYSLVSKRKRLRTKLINLTKNLNDKLGDSSLDGYITKIESLYELQNKKDDESLEKYSDD
jgi:hypothetical protein